MTQPARLRRGACRAPTGRPDAGADFGGPDTRSGSSISEQVANRILGMIKSGNLEPGDRLPTEAQMAVAFGISRPPLREALKALTIMGVLESRQGGRYYGDRPLALAGWSPPSTRCSRSRNTTSTSTSNAARSWTSTLVRLCTRARDARRAAAHPAACRDGTAFLTDPVGFRLLDYRIPSGAERRRAQHACSRPWRRASTTSALDVRRVASAVPGVIQNSVQQHIEVAEAVMAHDEDARRRRRHRAIWSTCAIPRIAVHGRDGPNPGEELTCPTASPSA